MKEGQPNSDRARFRFGEFVGTNPKSPEFRKTFQPGVRADITKIIEENPLLESTIDVLRKDPGHEVGLYMDDEGNPREYIVRKGGETNA